MAARKVSAVDSIDRLRRCKGRYSLTQIMLLLRARELYVSVSHLSRIVSPDPSQRREPSEPLRAELQTLAAELA